MKRMDRLMAVLIALQTGPLTAGQLAEKLEVSKRTILRDMEALAEMGVPLYAASGANGGYRLMADFHLDMPQLDADETLAILFALQSLEQLSDTPFRQARWTALDKLKAAMQVPFRTQAEQMLNRVQMPLPKRVVRSPLLAALTEHVGTGDWVSVQYRSERHARQLLIQPKRIYTAHGYWYCEALSWTHREVRTFRVDRMVDLEEAEAPTSFTIEIEQMFDTRKIDTFRLCARLSYRGALLAEQDEHIGDHVRQIEEEVWELQFDCPQSEWDWAVTFFYQLHTDAHVREPAALVQAIRQRAMKLMTQYGSDYSEDKQEQE